MKKIFTLIAAVVFGLGTINAQDEVDLDISNWGWGWSVESSYADGILTGTLTGGYGALSTGWNDAQDWSGYSKITAVIESYSNDWGKFYFQDSEGNAVTETTFSTINSQTKVELALSADLKGINDVKQLGIQGKAAGDVIKVSRVFLTKGSSEEPGETVEKELTLTEGHTILLSEFVDYPDEYQVKLSFANNTDPYEGRNGWGIGGFANADNWTPTYDIKGLDGQTFDVYVTVGDFKTAAKNGTDDYVEGQYHGAGVTFNIYNDCKLTAAYVIIPVSEGISNTSVAPVQNENAPIFNLAGQRLVKAQKGLNIVGGKKVIKK